MSATEQIDIDAVPVGPELDAAMIEYVLCWEYVPEKEMWEVPVPEREKWMVARMYTAELPFSTDMTSACIVEAEIKRRGLTREYSKELVESVLDHPHIFGGGKHTFDWFPIITATPDQRCRAAYRAVMGG